MIILYTVYTIFSYHCHVNSSLIPNVICVPSPSSWLSKAFAASPWSSSSSSPLSLSPPQQRQHPNSNSNSSNNNNNNNSNTKNTNTNNSTKNSSNSTSGVAFRRLQSQSRRFPSDYDRLRSDAHFWQLCLSVQLTSSDDSSEHDKVYSGYLTNQLVGQVGSFDVFQLLSLILYSQYSRMLLHKAWLHQVNIALLLQQPRNWNCLFFPIKFPFARMVMFHIHIHVDWRESIYNSMNYLRWLTTPQKLIQHQEPNTTTSCLCSQLGKHFRNRVVGQNLKMFFGTYPQPLKDIPPPSWLRGWEPHPCHHRTKKKRRGYLEAH